MGGSKKYKGKLCVYCRVNQSTTADHVFPRELFQLEHRGLLPKVPSCEKCNNEKSKLEHYLTAVLPFGGTHIDAETALSVDAAKRLKRNQKLQDRLRESAKDIVLQSSTGTVENRLAVAFDSDSLHNLVGFIGRGLIWHHWGAYLPIESSFKVFTPSEAGIEFLHNLFNLSTKYRVNTTSLSVDTVRYKGVMSESDMGLSVWAIQFLGGTTVVDEDSNSIFKNSFVAMVTGSPESLSKLELV
ncbi:hypothetical protein [Photobacterium kasasachensis]|uniref:hypothetical protein n=1 Tax=Photobacterium kasasachensis TaxID=2910240 RepID=UPI003D0CE948